MTLPSAILSMVAGFFLGFRGFLAYAAGVAESTNQVTDSPAAGGTKHVTFNVTANVEF